MREAQYLLKLPAGGSLHLACTCFVKRQGWVSSSVLRSASACMRLSVLLSADVSVRAETPAQQEPLGEQDAAEVEAMLGAGAAGPHWEAAETGVLPPGLS